MVVFLLPMLCWATMADLNCPVDKIVYRQSFCELTKVSDGAYLGRAVKVDSLSSTPIEMVYSSNNFPYNDSIYDIFVNKYRTTQMVHSRMKISVEFVYSNGKWKKIKENKDVYATEIRGWTWDGLDPMDFNYHYPIRWNDSLRVFFIRRTPHGDSLVGHSKTYKAVDSVQTSCFESRFSCRNLIDGCYKLSGRGHFCKTYDPYTISEYVFYGGMDRSDFLVYGMITSVFVQEIPISNGEKDFLLQSMDILKDSLRRVYTNAVGMKKRYDVVYKIEPTSYFDGKWKNIKGQNFEIHSVQEMGFDWFLSPTLYKVEIDSLDSSNRIFRVTKHDDGTKHLVYISKPEKKLPQMKFRTSYARKPGKTCLME